MFEHYAASISRVVEARSQGARVTDRTTNRSVPPSDPHRKLFFCRTFRTKSDVSTTRIATMT